MIKLKYKEKRVKIMYTNVKFEEGKRIIVVSDIHGDLTTFKKLLNKCEYNEEEDYLIILGDFLEKGTEILDTVHYVMELSKNERVYVLKGNCDRALEYCSNDDGLQDGIGYIKRMTVDNFKTQNRGGKGIKGMQTIEEDYIEDLLMTSTHDYLYFFTNYGRVYRMKAYEIPEASRTARGVAIVNLLQLNPGEKVSAMIPIKVEDMEGKNLFMATKKGLVKKTSLDEFANIRKTGLAAISLRDDDELIEVKLTNEESEIFLVTKQGMCIRFKETDVRATGRTSMGVIGMNLDDEDEIVAMQEQNQGDSLLIVSENGMGKRTYLDEFNVQYRGGKGVKCYKITEKTGDVVGAKAVNDDNEIMMITTEGIIIKLRVQDISTMGRIASGVKMMNLDEDVVVARIAKVKDKVEGESDEAEVTEDDENI